MTTYQNAAWVGLQGYIYFTIQKKGQHPESLLLSRYMISQYLYIFSKYIWKIIYIKSQ